MTKEDAKEYIVGLLEVGGSDGFDYNQKEALTMAIKALEQLNSIEFNSNPTQYNSIDLISRQAAIDDIRTMNPKDAQLDIKWVEMWLKQLPSAQPDWDNHTVACMLAELFGDDCACNYFGIDEWLPGRCELLDSCPNPVGVACWEQYLKHRAERRTDEGD